MYIFSKTFHHPLPVIILSSYPPSPSWVTCSCFLSLLSQAQAAVKEAKLRFDKLKIDLTEKIGMVNASRCNLLSRSLPTYQKAMLAFSDSAASEFHQVLVNLRSHHHHQYKLHSDMEQIRDLEAHELTESQLLSTLEGGNFPSPLQSSGDNDDEALLDVSKPPETTGGEKGAMEVGKEATEGSLIPLSPPAKESQGDMTEAAKKQAAIAHDLPLSGVEADLRALQKELLQEFGSSSPPRDDSLMTGAANRKGGDGGKEERGSRDDLRSADMDLNDLLGLGLGLEEGEGQDFGPLVSSSEEAVGEGDGKSSDVLTDQWNNFSSFMGTTRTPTKTSLSEWEEEFSMQSATSEKDPFEELDPLAAAKKQGKTSAGATGQGAPGLADDLLSLSLTNTSAPPAVVPSLVPSPAGPMAALPPSSQPHPQLLSTSGLGGASTGKPHPPASSKTAGAGKESEKKKEGSWMNVFAHLDPLSNEKA